MSIQVLLAAFFFIPNAAHAQQLVGSWSFEEGAGSTVAEETGARSYDGALVNMDPSSCWVAGVSGSALYLDGVDDYVDLGTPSAAAGSLTIAAWVRTSFASGSTSTDGQRWLVARSAWSGGAWQLMVPNGRPATEFGPGGQLIADSSFNIADDTWHQVLGVYDDDSGDRHLYLDGAWISSDTAAERTARGAAVAFTENGSDLLLGLRPGQTHTYEGAIDEVRIWNAALDAEEVWAQYESLACPDSSPVPGLPDDDGDIVGNPCDNCPLIANTNQEDGDYDGLGDACDDMVDGALVMVSFQAAAADLVALLDDVAPPGLPALLQHLTGKHGAVTLTEGAWAAYTAGTLDPADYQAELADAERVLVIFERLLDHSIDHTPFSNPDADSAHDLLDTLWRDLETLGEV